jgi:RNA polymerase sigma factor (sigma-70 family)
LRSFVLSVAANVLKWELRRRWVSRMVGLSATGTLPDVAGTRDDIEARQALLRCYEILDTLAPKERMAFVLRYMEEMTVHEVAATLSISASTAKRWVSRATAKVSEQIAENEDLRAFFETRQERTHET